MSFWRKYVPVAERRVRAAKKMDKLRKQGKDIQPVETEGRTIARSFWGKAWCDHLKSFSDYENRLPRGRTYVRNGSVCHLAVQPGRIEAMVNGSELDKVTIGITCLDPACWERIKKRCAGQIGSMLELLQGKLSGEVMAVVSDRKDGLFPMPREITLACSCPDWAVMCKHVAAALYGVGNRLGTRPDLLFLLRDVDAEELIAAEIALPAAAEASDNALAEEALGGIFGIDFDTGPETEPTPAPGPRPKLRPGGGKAPRKNTKGTSPKSIAPEVSARTTKPTIRPTGRSVARLRKKLHLTVPEFADALGIAAASVYRWESSQGRPKLHQRCLEALDRLHQQAKAAAPRPRHPRGSPRSPGSPAGPTAAPRPRCSPTTPDPIPLTSHFCLFSISLRY